MNEVSSMNRDELHHNVEAVQEYMSNLGLSMKHYIDKDHLNDLSDRGYICYTDKDMRALASLLASTSVRDKLEPKAKPSDCFIKAQIELYRALSGIGMGRVESAAVHIKQAQVFLSKV